MKNIFLSLLAGILVLGAVSCKKTPTPPGDGCIDPSQINRFGIVTDELNPVCGCDGKTYDNPSYAKNNGVRSWTDGACEENKGDQ